MVLSSVPTDQEIKPPTIGGQSLDKIKNDVASPEDEEDSLTTTVYGSKWAARDLPRHEMPEDAMPREVAYRMIKCVLVNGQPLGQSADKMFPQRRPNT